MTRLLPVEKSTLASAKQQLAKRRGRKRKACFIPFPFPATFLSLEASNISTLTVSLKQFRDNLILQPETSMATRVYVLFLTPPLHPHMSLLPSACQTPSSCLPAGRGAVSPWAKHCARSPPAAFSPPSLRSSARVGISPPHERTDRTDIVAAAATPSIPQYAYVEPGVRSEQ